MIASAEPGAASARRRIILLTASALAAALLILFGAVLPAEYHRDPIGLGRLTGIDALWAPEERIVAPAARAVPAAASRSFRQRFRDDVVEIPLKAAGDPEHGDELEYKVAMKKGASYIYSWEAPGIANIEEFYTEFHGHTVGQGEPMTVAFYRKATGVSDNGVFTAPFDGVHGWYFQNQSERPVTVRLRVAGFYELVPAGQPGNEAGFVAKPVE